MAVWDWLFDPSGLTPHGFCLIWAPGLIALHLGSDLVTGLAYFSIPVALVWFARARRDVHYAWILILFGAFILACGLTHVFAIVTLWVPVYGIEGLVKLTTAALSIATAITLWPLVPRLLALPSPAELERLNVQLSEKIVEQESTASLLRDSEARIRIVNGDLERRVSERTADLRASNSRLAAALAEREAAEAELQKAKRDLEGVVAERTAALKQRDLLLREVYHRVKNNLQIVDSLVLLQARQLDGEKAREALLSLRSRIYALGLVHQQLMASSDLQTFDIAPFLQELATNILHGGPRPAARLSVVACRLSVTLDFAIPLGLLVTELMTNALRHADLGECGRIVIDLRQPCTALVVLTVEDDGRTIWSGEFGPSAGFGSRIVAGLVNQLEGRMTVRYEHGTRIEVSLPVPEPR